MAAASDRSECDIHQELTRIFRGVFRRYDLDLRAHMSAADIAGWDSFKQIEIIIAVEEQFMFTFTARELDSLMNVGDIIHIVASKKAPM